MVGILPLSLLVFWLDDYLLDDSSLLSSLSDEELSSSANIYLSTLKWFFQIFSFLISPDS